MFSSRKSGFGTFGILWGSRQPIKTTHIHLSVTVRRWLHGLLKEISTGHRHAPLDRISGWWTREMCEKHPRITWIYPGVLFSPNGKSTTWGIHKLVLFEEGSQADPSPFVPNRLVSHWLNKTIPAAGWISWGGDMKWLRSMITQKYTYLPSGKLT